MGVGGCCLRGVGFWWLLFEKSWVLVVVVGGGLGVGGCCLRGVGCWWLLFEGGWVLVVVV